MNGSNLKRGEVVGFVFAQPGNDTTYLLLTEVRAEDADAWDLMFDMDVKALKLTALWPARQCEMESRTTFVGGKRSGSFSVQQLADEARQALGLGATPQPIPADADTNLMYHKLTDPFTPDAYQDSLKKSPDQAG